MPKKSDRLSLREARDYLRDQFFAPADSSDAAWNEALDRANEAIELAIMSGQVPWWYMPVGKLFPRLGDSSQLREPDSRDIFNNELRLKTNRDGCFDETTSTILREPADFLQVAIERSRLETFVRDLPETAASDADTDTAADDDKGAASKPATRKRGRPPDERERVKAAIQADINSSALRLDIESRALTKDGKALLGKELATRYNTSRDTANKAIAALCR